MSGDSGGVGGRLLNTSMGLLLAAMALYGAIAIVQSIWVPLCIVVAIVVTIGGVGWAIHRRIRRW